VHSRRAIVNAIVYLDRTGCAWRYLPRDFPPWQTVYGYFAAWRDDGGYAGKLITWAKTSLRLTLQIVRQPDDLHTFQVLPRRWVVERTFAWISTCRRCARDCERLPASHEAMVLWAMIAPMSQRLAP
jgi:transposase